jgi:hypothetical protein
MRSLSLSAVADLPQTLRAEVEALEVAGRSEGVFSVEAAALLTDGGAIRRRQEDTPQFQHWFQNSKVRDADGEPLVVYHATPNTFDEFKPGGSNPRLSGRAIWFSPNADRQPASHNIGYRVGHYKEGTNVIPAYVNMVMPLIIDSDTREWAKALYGDSFPEVIRDEALAEIRADYDGILYYDRSGALSEVIVFEPHQVKSSIANSGQFDPKSPNILFDRSDADGMLQTGDDISELAAFSRWFGESKIIDGEGAPLVVHHFTHNTFHQFDRQWAATNLGRDPEGVDTVGMWFTDNVNAPYVAPGRGNRMDVYLTIKKPFYIDDIEVGDGFDQLQTMVKAAGGATNFRQSLSTQGYDGIVLNGTFLDGVRQNAFIALEPWQVKSSVKNTGAFDPGTSDIRFSTVVDEGIAQLAQRPTSDTNGRSLEVTPGAAEAFWQWFGLSVAVGEDGKPLVVYHGTADDFSAFEDGKWSKADQGWLGRGFYFTSSPKTAGSYANTKGGSVDPNIMPVYLSLRNPFRASIRDKERGMFAERRGDKEAPLRTRAELIAQGYDGVVLDYASGGYAQELEYVVFHPEQIKSALSNNGAYSPASPDIRFSRAEAGPHLRAAPSAFDRWFSGSQVADENGIPLRVFHGTAADFGEFKKTDGWYGRGIYFTDNVDYANEFAEEAGLDSDGGDNIVPVYLSLKRPYIFKERSQSRASNMQLMRELGLSDRRIKKAINVDDNAPELIADTLMEQGHDGLIVLSADGRNEYVAFDPSQAKSTIGNSGEYSSDSPDIRFSRVDPDELESWFGNSKITQADGKPLLVFHGTDADFKKFDLGIAGQNTGSGGFLGQGIYFTDRKQSAQQYGSKLKMAYLRMENPALLSGDMEQNVRQLGLERLYPKGCAATFGEILAARDAIRSGISEHRIGRSQGMREWLNDFDVDYAGVIYTIRSVSNMELQDGDEFVRDRLVNRILWELHGLPDIDNLGSIGNAVDPQALTQTLRENGFDGVIGEGTNITDVGAMEYAVFDPNQILTVELPQPALGADQAHKDGLEQWFGKSMVVDAAGAPLRVFHGSRGNVDISVFQASYSEMDAGERGIYFTDSPAHASEYACEWGDGENGSVYPVFLRILNPQEVSVEDWNAGRGPSPEEARAAGHDGYIIRGQEGGDTYVVFASDQVKSSTGNVGTYNPDLDDIRFLRQHAELASSERLKESELDAVKCLAEVFGTQVGLLRLSAESAFRFNGVKHNNMVWLNVESKRPLHVVFGHELLHMMKTDRPDIYRDLHDAIVPMLVGQDDYARRTRLAGHQADYVQEEMIADLLGDRFAEESFWRQVAQHRPSVFGRIAEYVSTFASRVKDAFAGLVAAQSPAADQFVSDLDRTRALLAKAVADYAASQQAGVQDYDPQAVAQVLASHVDEDLMALYAAATGLAPTYEAVFDWVSGPALDDDTPGCVRCSLLDLAARHGMVIPNQSYESLRAADLVRIRMPAHERPVSSREHVELAPV